MPETKTPKQKLIAHIEADHGGMRGNRRSDRIARLYGQPAGSWTMDRLATWHARQHHRYVTNHYHAGPNTDASNRPPGWRTGEDAVRNA